MLDCTFILEHEFTQFAKHSLPLAIIQLQSIGEALTNDTKIEGPDTGDDAAEVQEERDQQEQIVGNYSDRQAEIERAIKWIKEKGGICAVCGKKIEGPRRDINPASITCIEHKDQENSLDLAD